MSRLLYAYGIFLPQGRDHDGKVFRAPSHGASLNVVVCFVLSHVIHGLAVQQPTSNSSITIEAWPCPNWQPSSAWKSFTMLVKTLVPQINTFPNVVPVLESSFARGVINLRADIELNYILFVALPEIEAVRDLPVGPNCPVVYKHVQPITVKKSDTRHAKPKDTNSTKVGNNNSGAKTMADAAETALSDTVCSKGDMSDVNVKNNKNVNLDNDDSDIDVIEDSNETTSFMHHKVYLRLLVLLWAEVEGEVELI
ncbi:hypothetical protein Tco_0931511 [Tanacetum coccineum]